MRPWSTCLARRRAATRRPARLRGRRGPAGCVLAVAGGGAGAALALHYDGHTTTVASAPPASPAAGGGAGGPLAKVAAAVLASIVTITVTTGTQRGEGSGVITGSDDTILTNNHVIDAAAGGAGTIKVIFSSGRTATASIVGQDASADLAVIRAAGVSGLAPAAFGSASGLRVGDTVQAIGSPLGLAGSVTSGIVSALHRTITVGSQSSQPYNGTLGQSSQSASIISNMIQTDTAINPGNSGGATAVPPLMTRPADYVFTRSPLPGAVRHAEHAVMRRSRIRSVFPALFSACPRLGIHARLLLRRGPVRLRLRFHLREAGVVVGELIEVGPRDLRRHDDVIVGDIGRRVARAVLKLDVHPHPELLEAERGSIPVDADPQAGGAGLLESEGCARTHAANTRCLAATPGHLRRAFRWRLLLAGEPICRL